MLRYATHAKESSLYNTPPSFGIYLMGRVFQWILRQGGLAGMEAMNREKAQLLYDALAATTFYDTHAGEGSRSLMNITFRTPSKELDAKFVKEAEAAGFAGSRAPIVGGMRPASTTPSEGGRPRSPASCRTRREERLRRERKWDVRQNVKTLARRRSANNLSLDKVPALPALIDRVRAGRSSRKGRDRIRSRRVKRRDRAYEEQAEALLDGAGKHVGYRRDGSGKSLVDRGLHSRRGARASAP